MDINILREAVTVLSFITFLGIVWFAVHPGNGKRFEEAANLPLVDDEPFEGEVGQTSDRVTRTRSID